MTKEEWKSMYSKITLEKYADVLIWGLGVSRKKPLKKSDLILVRYDIGALPLAEALLKGMHERGFIPIPRMEMTDAMAHDFYSIANNKRLTFEIPGERELYAKIAGMVRLHAPESLDNLADVDPDQMRIANQGKRPLHGILEKRERAGEYSWTMGVYPTQEPALASDMSIEEYAQAIKLACKLDRGSPVSDWKILRKQFLEITNWLNQLKISTLRVQSESMDLLMRPGTQRKWTPITGRNMPSYEIYLSPDWRSVEGSYFADLLSFRYGLPVKDFRVEFRMGEAVRAQARIGHTVALDQFRTDQNANKVGEFALVDKRFSQVGRFMANPLYDENYGGAHGSCHIALGQSHAQSFDGDPLLLDANLAAKLGFNNSALHWDLVNTEDKRVTAKLESGKRVTIYENGQFVY